MSDAYLSLVDALQRQAALQVAFYPKERLRRALEQGEIEIAFENGEPCGYLWHGPYNPGRDAVIYQAIIHYDLRRRSHGEELVARIDRHARAKHCTAVRCRCRSDIEANDFWRSLGFACVATFPNGSTRRAANLNVWRAPIVPGLFDHETQEPVIGKWDASAYVIGGSGRNRYDRSKRLTGWDALRAAEARDEP